MAVDLKESAGITDEMSRGELEMLAAVTWGDLAHEQYENRRLKTLVAEMFKEHQRIYDIGSVLSATSGQMAHWYSECMRWGIEVDG